MQFKTNAKCSACVTDIQNKISSKFPNQEISAELSDVDNVLHVHGVPENSENASRIESAIKEAGFEGAWLTRGEENK